MASIYGKEPLGWKATLPKGCSYNRPWFDICYDSPLCLNGSLVSELVMNNV